VLNSTKPNCVVISKPQLSNAYAGDQIMAAECILTGRLGIEMEISVKSWVEFRRNFTGISHATREACDPQAFPYILTSRKIRRSHETDSGAVL
jgi:hypothetical protein